MIIKDLFDKANQTAPMSQDEFLAAFNEGVWTLLAKYGEGNVFEAGETQEATSVNDELPIYPEWRECLLCYVIYAKNGDAVRYERFEGLGSYAHRTVWSKKFKKRRFKTPSWL